SIGVGAMPDMHGHERQRNRRHLDFGPEYKPVRRVKLATDVLCLSDYLNEMAGCIRVRRICHDSIDLAERRHDFQAVAEIECAVSYPLHALPRVRHGPTSRAE